MRYFISKNADIISCRALLQGVCNDDSVGLTIFTDESLDKRRTLGVTLPTRQVTRCRDKLSIKINGAQATIVTRTDGRGYELKFEETLMGKRAEKRLLSAMRPVGLTVIAVAPAAFS